MSGRRPVYRLAYASIVVEYHRRARDFAAGHRDTSDSNYFFARVGPFSFGVEFIGDEGES